MIPDKNDIKLLSFLFSKYINQHRVTIFGLLASSLMFAFSNSCQPFFIKIILDDYLLENSGDYFVLVIEIAFFILILAQSISLYCIGYLSDIIGIKVTRRLREDLFQYLLSTPLRIFDSNLTGELVSKFIEDVEIVEELVIDAVASFLSQIILLAFIFCLMVYLNWQVACLMIFLLPFWMMISRKFDKAIYRTSHAVRNLSGKFEGFIKEMLGDITSIQIHNQIHNIYQKASLLSRNLGKNKIKLNEYSQLRLSIVEAYGIIIITLLIIYTGLIAVNNAVFVFGVSMSIGTVVSFIRYLARFNMALAEIQRFSGNLQKGIVALERISSIIENAESAEVEKTLQNGKEDNAVDHLATTGKVFEFQGKIELRHVWFSYDNTSYALENVSFTVKPNEILAIVGASGTGKTTLINLICGFYSPQKGKLLFDDIDVKSLHPNRIREKLGVVLQDTLLFPGTIFENIAFFRKDVSRDRILHAATLVGADECISALPDGYDTIVSEGGKNLSAGQKQLISMARVLIKDPKVIILDEATSNVDPITERRFQKGLQAIAENRTVIIIAHQYHSLCMADFIFNLNLNTKDKFHKISMNV